MRTRPRPLVLALAGTLALGTLASGQGTEATSTLAAAEAADDRGGPPDEKPGQGRGPGDRGNAPWQRGEDPGDPGEDPHEPGEDPDEPTEPELAPFDYVAQADQLSQPDFATTLEEVMVPMSDGESLSVRITRPDAEGRFPVVMEASPYHGTISDYEGRRIFPDPRGPDGEQLGLTGYFAPRGYAVVMVALRGTDRSTGCLDHLGPDDARDLKEIVEWAASQPWSDGKVGMTGHSYVGSTPSVAAGMQPEGLVTIAPSAGLASMYDHQFQHGVPWFLQYIGPVIAYEQLALERDLPGGVNFEQNGPNPQFGCGLPNSAATAGHGQVTGQYQGWHAERDHGAAAAAADLPIFMIHGVNDNAARIPAADWFFHDREPRADDKVWIGQWDHGSAGNTTCDTGHVTCRYDQWQFALHAWFDHHLKGMDVDTGPGVEAFLNGQNVAVSEIWDPSPGVATLYPDATDGSLSFEPPADDASTTFTSLAGDGSVEFVSEPLDEPLLLQGVPELELAAAVTGQIVHLVTTLWVEDSAGVRRAANFCAINTHLRDDVSSPSPVIPGQRMDLQPGCFTQTHAVAAGERLVLEVGTTSVHHVPSFAHDLRIEVFTGPEATSYALPASDAAVFADTVPLRAGEDGGDGGDGGTPTPTPSGPAQEPVTDTVTLVAPSADLFSIDGVTDASVPFAIEDGVDNARLDAVASVTVPADIDLYLERETAEGWEVVATGASFDLAGETLTAARPEPGSYRLRVQNWAGGPNQVEVLIRFVNTAGEVGGS